MSRRLADDNSEISMELRFPKVMRKRNRPQKSCSECHHRLKIKCDRQKPCNSCVRRGCISRCKMEVQKHDSVRTKLHFDDDGSSVAVGPFTIGEFAPPQKTRLEYADYVVSILPSKESRMHLIEVFLCKVQTIFHFVHSEITREAASKMMDTFERQTVFNSGDMEKLSKIYIILAIGDFFEGGSNHQEYYSASQMCLQLSNYMSRCGLQSLSVVVMSSFYLFCSPSSTNWYAGWSMIGLAYRLAIGMGINKEDPDWNLSGLNIVLRKRLWWNIILLERYASSFLGRPCFCRPFDIPETSLLYHCDDAEVDINTVNVTSYPLPGEPTGVYMSTTLICFLEKLMRIWQSVDNISGYEELLKIDRDIHNFKSRLPQGFEPVASVSLLLMVNLTLYAVHRPYFLASLKGNKFIESRKACVSLSKDIIDILDSKIDQLDQSFLRFWFFIQGILTATICLAAYKSERYQRKLSIIFEKIWKYQPELCELGSAIQLKLSSSDCHHESMILGKVYATKVPFGEASSPGTQSEFSDILKMFLAA
ncbi:hypothetical protein V1511DRAFT_502461 [Dipodascopsis uninucleata]